MKKITLICFCIFFSWKGYSQQTSAGVKAGVNFSILSNAENAETLTGITAGGLFVYSIVEHFGVSADVLYSGEGAKYTYDVMEGVALVHTVNKLRLNYLRVPLLANVFFGKLGDQIRPKIFLGPSFGFLLGVKNEATVTTTEGSTVSEVKTSSSDKKGFKGFDLGAIIGAGLNYKVGEKTWLNLDAKYHIGASDIRDIKLQNQDAIKNNVFSVSLGLAFGLSE